MKMQPHVTILGWIFYLIGCMGLLYALSLPVLVVLVLAFRTDEQAARADPGVGLVFVFAVIYMLIALPVALGGWGLRRRKPWSIYLTRLLSCLVLFLWPVGTLIGGYGLWVLFSRESRVITGAVKPPRPDATLE